MDMGLSGKRALVTGSSAGLGRAIAGVGRHRSSGVLGVVPQRHRAAGGDRRPGGLPRRRARRPPQRCGYPRRRWHHPQRGLKGVEI